MSVKENSNIVKQVFLVQPLTDNIFHNAKKMMILMKQQYIIIWQLKLNSEWYN